MSQREMQEAPDHIKAGLCPHYEAAFELLGRRWTGLIVTTLVDGPRRFSEIGGSVSGLSDRMLSQRLSELEEAGIVRRIVDASRRPVQVRYELTKKGAELRPVFEALQSWAERWMPAG
ncbi:MAG: winged helix-turn-helix transcriptional regulator [Chloroflexota bacterium]